MYEQFYGLREKPFTLTPNPRYIFYTDRYRAALEHLLYGIDQREGFMLLTGMVGTGKTTLCRELLERLRDGRTQTALIFNPFLNATELLQALLTEFGCSFPPDASKRDLLDRLNRYLLAQLVAGHTCVAVIDEAQHLSPELLEQMRVLSNLETETEKLLQIILVGQPELRERIQQPSLAQLDQRVSLRCSLSDLTLEETERYIYHRLQIAGASGGFTFTRAAIRRLHQESQGIPRLINLIADRTLLAGYVSRATKLAPKHVRQALQSLRGEDSVERAPAALSGRSRSNGWRSRWRRPLALTAALLMLLLAGVAAAWYAGALR
jgi:general secretion pathway protein A